jgi:hypothetical protein
MHLSDKAPGFLNAIPFFFCHPKDLYIFSAIPHEYFR